VIRVELSNQARWDLARLADFLVDQNPAAARATAALIVDALRILARYPRIGRPAQQPLRELVIQRGQSGYVALYRVDPLERFVEILAIRHQRESGYKEEDL